MNGAQRITVGAVAPTITATFRDGSGMPTDVGAVTVGVVDWAGVVKVTPGTATTTEQVGVYEATLPNGLAVTQLTATWTASGPKVVTTTVEVVGSRLVWPDEFITQPGVGFSGRSPGELSAAIAWFEDLTYRVLNWSPIERFRRATVRSSDHQMVLPDHYILDLLGVTWQAVDTADVAATSEELALFEVTDSGLLSGSYVTSKALVAYRHGNEAARADLHDAAMTAIRLHLLENTAGRPAISVADGAGGTTRFSFAGPGRPTGIPEVDAVLNGMRIPVCA